MPDPVLRNSSLVGIQPVDVFTASIEVDSGAKADVDLGAFGARLGARDTLVITGEVSSGATRDFVSSIIWLED